MSARVFGRMRIESLAPAGPLATDIDPVRGALGGKMGQFRHAVEAVD